MGVTWRFLLFAFFVQLAVFLVAHQFQDWTENRYLMVAIVLVPLLAVGLVLTKIGRERKRAGRKF